MTEGLTLAGGMDMLWSRWLTKDDDFTVFQREFERRSGNPVDLGYLKGSQVRGYFTNAGEMLAGYVVRTSSPLRYFAWLTPADQQRRPGDSFGEDDFAEITCIWMKSGRIENHERAQIYIESIAFGVLSGKPAILGGTFVDRVWRQQMDVMRYPFRDGVSTFRTAAAPYWLYYGLSREMIPLFIKQMVLFCLRAGQKHRRMILKSLAAKGVEVGLLKQKNEKI